MGISPSDFRAMQLRLAPKHKQVVPEDAVTDESELHDEIIAYCLQRQYVCVHSRMDKRTTQQPGVADFIITMPPNRTVYVEAKAKGKKMSIEQQAFKCLVEHNGGEYHLVYSLGEFVAKLAAHIPENATLRDALEDLLACAEPTGQDTRTDRAMKKAADALTSPESAPPPPAQDGQNPVQHD